MKTIKRTGWASARKMLVAMCATAMCVATGCKEEDDESKQRNEPAQPIEIEGNLKSVSAASNNFSMRFFETVCSQKEGNILVSPYSMQVALAMTVNGASGKTKDEIMKALGYEGKSLEEMNAYNKSLTSTLSTLDPKTTVAMANGLWIIPAYDFREAFVKACREYYDAEARKVEFEDGTGQKDVSQWAEDKTKGMIKNAGESISEDASAAIVNATYFAGQWATQFDKKNTCKSVFYNADGSEGQVDMMSLDGVTFTVKMAEKYSIIRMPYGNGAYSMDLLLPEGETTLDKIEMSEETWNMEGDDVMETECSICLPRFEMEMDYKCKEILYAMGIESAFTPASEFKGMTTGDPFVRDVTQKTKMKVDEEGTKAAAVTIVEMYDKATMPYIFNRPFAFLIREQSTQAVLFAGKVVKR